MPLIGVECNFFGNIFFNLLRNFTARIVASALTGGALVVSVSCTPKVDK